MYCILVDHKETLKLLAVNRHIYLGILSLVLLNMLRLQPVLYL